MCFSAYLRRAYDRVTGLAASRWPISLQQVDELVGGQGGPVGTGGPDRRVYADEKDTDRSDARANRDGHRLPVTYPWSGTPGRFRLAPRNRTPDTVTQATLHSQPRFDHPLLPLPTRSYFGKIFFKKTTQSTSYSRLVRFFTEQ